MHHTSRCIVRCSILACLLLVSGMARAVDHGTWNELLETHVQWTRDGHASIVDYPGMAADADRLNRYLDRLSDVDQQHYEQFSHDEKLAFLINAYNAFTVKLILKQHGLPDSIRDIGGWFSGPWEQRFFTLLGRKRTLDELEDRMIRGNAKLMDPRVHFALNCASVSCPALRPAAYTAEQLDQQLDDQARRFLSDSQRNHYDADSNTLRVSSIFTWYQDDFATAAGSLGQFLARYAVALDVPQSKRQALRGGAMTCQFRDYDWSLNGAGSAR